MTRDRAKELLPVIQAFAEGKDIEYKPGKSSCWNTVSGSEIDFELFIGRLRIKATPKEWWYVVRRDNGTVWYMDADRKKVAESYATFDPEAFDIIHVREVLE